MEKERDSERESGGGKIITRTTNAARGERGGGGWHCPSLAYRLWSCKKKGLRCKGIRQLMPMTRCLDSNRIAHCEGVERVTMTALILTLPVRPSPSPSPISIPIPEHYLQSRAAIKADNN